MPNSLRECAATDHRGFRLRGLETTRIETFTDAAFAFALTLLVVSLDPPTSIAELLAALRDVPAFLASASLLMAFWWGHHEWSRRYGLDDGPTVLLSCLLVFTVLVFVYPLKFMFGLLFSYVGHLTDLPLGSGSATIEALSDVNTMFTLYGVAFTAMCLALLLLHVHAWRRRTALRLTRRETYETATKAGIWSLLAGVGLTSAAVALATPPTVWGWPGWVYMILPVAVPSFSRLRERNFPAA